MAQFPEMYVIRSRRRQLEKQRRREQLLATRSLFGYKDLTPANAMELWILGEEKASLRVK